MNAGLDDGGERKIDVAARHDGDRSARDQPIRGVRGRQLIRVRIDPADADLLAENPARPVDLGNPHQERLAGLAVVRSDVARLGSSHSDQDRPRILRSAFRRRFRPASHAQDQPGGERACSRDKHARHERTPHPRAERTRQPGGRS
jgi:hypothetical protein